MEEIHRRMVGSIQEEGGRIDAVYFSPHLESRQHHDRKPGIGMALKAQRDFPAIRLDRAVMIGDSLSDMQFGRNCGMINILIGSEASEDLVPEELYDLCFKGLADFANEMTRSINNH